MATIKDWLKSITVAVALLDGTFFTFDEVAGRRSDAQGIAESIALLGKRVEGIDPEIIFIHLKIIQKYTYSH